MTVNLGSDVTLSGYSCFRRVCMYVRVIDAASLSIFHGNLSAISPPAWFPESNPLSVATPIRFTPIPCLQLVK
jgi:hypothetical protein